MLGNISGNILGDRLGNLVGNVNAGFIWTDDIEVEQELKVDFIAPLLTNEICVDGDFKITGNLTVGTRHRIILFCFRCSKRATCIVKINSNSSTKR